MKTMLIVDDDLVLRSTLKRVLSRYQLTVFEAADSDSALAITEQQTIDLALIDLKLKDESGLVLSTDLLAKYPDIKIVIMTGYASIATAINAIKLGVINYLVKPVSAQEILAAFADDSLVQPQQTIDTQAMSPKRLEWEHIQRVLLKHDGNISQTAQALNMHRRTLQRKLKKKPVNE